MLALEVLQWHDADTDTLQQYSSLKMAKEGGEMTKREWGGRKKRGTTTVRVSKETCKRKKERKKRGRSD